MLQSLTSILLRVHRSVDPWRRLALLLLLALLLPGARAAGTPEKRHWDLAGGDAAQTLRTFVELSGEQVFYLVPKVRGVKTNPVRGDFTAREAIAVMLARTALVAVEDEHTGAFMINRVPPARAAAPEGGAKEPPQDPPPPMKRKHPLALFSTWLALALAPGHSAAAADPAGVVDPAQLGTLAGTISNAATGAYLEGAEISVAPGGATALTARDGRYALSLPAGSYQVTIRYTGLDPETIPVTVRAGGSVTQDAALTAGIYKLSAFVVESEREGNALAVTQQRNAPNVKNVISSDAFGNVADLNLANFLMRVPGFSTEISEGEIMRVQIRGTSPNLNSFSIDGTRGANGSTRTYERGADIDRISADFIETIEVSKAMTPDIDADSIGGAVNLKTKSALDRKGRRINYSFANNYNVSQKAFRPLGSAGYSDLLLDGRLGVLATVSYNESLKPRDCNTIVWERTTDTSRPAWFNANAFGRDQLRHRRAGASVRFDYKVSDATRVYVSTAFSAYDDQLNRRWIRLSTPSNANVTILSPQVVESRNQTFTFYQLLRNRDVRTLNLGAGLESTVWGGKLDASLNYSESHGTDLDRMTPQRTVSGTAWHQEMTAPNNGIVLRQIGGPAITDWRNSTLGSFDLQDFDSNDQIYGAQLNYRKPLPTRFPLALKTGLRARQQTRTRDNDRNLNAYVGPNGVVGPVGAANDDNLERFYDAGYDYVPNKSQPKNAGLPSLYMDMAKLLGELRQSPQLFKRDVGASVRDSIRNDTEARELVSAGYVMADARFGRLGIVTGVRVEDTRVTGKGFRQEITAEEKARRAAWTGPVTSEETDRRTRAEYGNRVSLRGQYRDYFPSIHFRYRITPNFLARLSYSNGIGRPNFGSIVPSMSVNHDEMTVTANNPSLKPQYSKNYDATLEYYFEPAGLVSVAVFEKRLTDFIFRKSRGELQPGNEYGDAYVGYMLTTDFNGGYARIRGLEASYQQQFTNLPGFWSGFGLFANATWLETKGDYGDVGSVVTQSELPNFTPRAANVGVSYIRNRWTVRVMANHTGNRLIVYNDDPSQREYQFATTPIDVNLAYAFSKKFRVYVDVIDVFNVGRQNQYLYVPERKSATFVYSTVVKVGISGNF
ncbi:TonB-dependent receptor [Opitutus sp. ER46]|uniref:TonB-dependent receptor n=1 Tax=Opitutus sp. ER46 TaxID=2161864 RepID=UPI000D3004D3|nr:TonB-dependent receptor [Opitutus sp. ER46]PTX98540.1 hypothetical protein DB354_04565 [Opitutus sp. ER46]